MSQGEQEDDARTQAQDAPDYRLSIRIYFPSGMRIGRGKIALLEAVAKGGSISGAARLLDMSYKRAWDLLDEMNRHFAERVIVTTANGGPRGGAELSAFGARLIQDYRAFEAEAYAAGARHLRHIAQEDRRDDDTGPSSSRTPV